jgi:hypothetical protein
VSGGRLSAEVVWLGVLVGAWCVAELCVSPLPGPLVLDASSVVSVDVALPVSDRVPEILSIVVDARRPAVVELTATGAEEVSRVSTWVALEVS